MHEVQVFAVFSHVRQFDEHSESHDEELSSKCPLMHDVKTLSDLQVLHRDLHPMHLPPLR